MFRGGETHEATAASMVGTDSKGRDRAQVVSRRNLKFAGAATESMDLFLKKIEEIQKSANMSESELMVSLPLMFSGIAYLQYSNRHQTWQIWEPFSSAARKRWSTRIDV